MVPVEHEEALSWILALARELSLKDASPRSFVYQDLGLNGDDAYGFLERIAKHFGTNFSAFAFSDYFPGETEAIWHGLVNLVRPRAKWKWKTLTPDQLAAAVAAGRWDESQTQSADRSE